MSSRENIYKKHWVGQVTLNTFFCLSLGETHFYLSAIKIGQQIECLKVSVSTLKISLIILFVVYDKLVDECDCDKIKEDLEEGKNSEALKSSITNRNVERRKGVSEHSDMERKLVKESVAVMVLTANLNEYNLM